MRQLALIVSIFVLTMLSGCTTIERSIARDSEQLLAASGFRMKLADTPEKLAHLKTLTQRVVVPHERNGKTYFVYADALYCKCMYIGKKEDYERYKKMVVKRNIADTTLENESTNWGQWGLWGVDGW